MYYIFHLTRAKRKSQSVAVAFPKKGLVNNFYWKSGREVGGNE